MTHAGFLTGAAVESPRRLWARCLAQYRVFQSCAGPLAGTEMGVFAAAGTPYLALGGVARSRKREKCYRTIDIIKQMGSCRIISNYGYSPGVQWACTRVDARAALVGNVSHMWEKGSRTGPDRAVAARTAGRKTA